jgi:hypothetical protein
MKPIVVFYINIGDNTKSRTVQMLSHMYNNLISEDFKKEYWVFLLPVQYQETRVELLHAKGSEQLDIEKLDEEVKNMIKNYNNDQNLHSISL